MKRRAQWTYVIAGAAVVFVAVSAVSAVVAAVRQGSWGR